MPMLTVEFHCHTNASKDSLVTPEALVLAARRRGLARLIITDHNTTAGALTARQLAPEMVVVGEEIMTSRGELLAAYVQEAVPPGLAPRETIRRLREQGAFISVSHPFDTLRSGHWQEQDLLDILPLVDAIETFNARCFQPRFNWQAEAFARRWGMAGTVGSDAHAAFELGRAVLRLPVFSDGASLQAVIRQGSARTRLSSPLVHLISRYAVVVKALRSRRQ